jgi:hypothetical protein
MLTRLAPRRAPSPRPAESPELVAFCIVEREDGSATWIRCGRARLNRDGSVNVRLDALPLNGELHLRPARPPSSSEGVARSDAGPQPGMSPGD